MAGYRTLIFPVATLFLAGCSGMGSLTSTDQADGEADRPPVEVELATEPPEFNARSTGQHRGIAMAECNTGIGLADARQEARDVLKRRAASNGADYVRVQGSGDLEDRGFCRDGYYRVIGDGFARLSEPARAATPDTTDSLSSRLEELEGLRDRGLLNQNEYEQLRERVLDEAY
ncbi:SHOCT domain-containing protein [Spiribacter vilamensis]|uniref:SHOCT domain-containing protein n=1 Tax=Spiribacter vilamensis TaxID=531306 RepID=A0A4Q8D145_9GAMM|nr:SHOCT domain-containing protein [Spiribacter vilamensis]RZU99033.1 hypothetical protein EV698_1309 [Spiribacter vilamensis]TVO61965.1 SHOCT domain-containing protein [Spiribacter vilamensis]